MLFGSLLKSHTYLYKNLRCRLFDNARGRFNKRWFHVLYEIRGKEIDRLKLVHMDEKSALEDRIRTLEHNKALNERENNTLKARLENLERQCQAQSETNRSLQSNIDEFKLKLSESERNCSQLTNDLKTERLLCETQREQLTSYQRSGK